MLMIWPVFRQQLQESPVMRPFASTITWTIPFTEIAISILLLVPKWRIKGLYSSFMLMLIFTVYVVVVMTTSSHLPCSCGGIIEKLSWTGHLIFNACSTLLAALAIIIYRQKMRNEYPSEQINMA
jgi:hypothetical protein